MKAEIVKLVEDKVYDGMYSIIFDINGVHAQTNTVYTLDKISSRHGIDQKELEKKIKK